MHTVELFCDLFVTAGKSVRRPHTGGVFRQTGYDEFQRIPEHVVCLLFVGLS